MNNLNIELNSNKEVNGMDKLNEVKLVYRAFWKLYQNEKGEYLVGKNMGSPFVIPIKSIIAKKGNKIFYKNNENESEKTRFLLITDGSYDGSSIVDLDSRYIIFSSKHNNTLIQSHTILEEQIQLNMEFLSLPPSLVKEVVKKERIIRIFHVGLLRQKNVFINDYTKNKDYFPNYEQFDFTSKELSSHFKSKHTFFEFVEKEKCFVIKNWWKVEYI